MEEFLFLLSGVVYVLFSPFLFRSSGVLFTTVLKIVQPTRVKTKAFKMAALTNESRYHLLEWHSRSR